MYHIDVANTTPDQVAVAILDTLPRSMRAIRGQMRSGRAEGLSIPQFRLLFFVRRNPGCSLSSLSDHLGTTLPATSQIVDRLVRSGFVTRIQAPEERRRIELRLTDAGTTALAACDDKTRAWLCERLTGLDERRLEALARSLADLRAALSDGDPQK